MLVRAMTTAVIVMMSTASAWAADPAEGRKIAQRWCAECHLVSPDQSGSVPVGPPTFETIAKGQAGNADYLKTFLAAPHTKDMRGLKLNRYDINDLAAYIGSLGTN